MKEDRAIRASRQQLDPVNKNARIRRRLPYGVRHVPGSSHLFSLPPQQIEAHPLPPEPLARKFSQSIGKYRTPTFNNKGRYDEKQIIEKPVTSHPLADAQGFIPTRKITPALLRKLELHGDPNDYPDYETYYSTSSLPEKKRLSRSQFRKLLKDALNITRRRDGVPVGRCKLTLLTESAYGKPVVRFQGDLVTIPDFIYISDDVYLSVNFADLCTLRELIRSFITYIDVPRILSCEAPAKPSLDVVKGMENSVIPACKINVPIKQREGSSFAVDNFSHVYVSTSPDFQV